MACLGLIAALGGCGGGGGGGSTRYDTTASGNCLKQIPQTIVTPGDPVQSGELLAVFFQKETASANIFFGESEDAAKQEFDRRAAFLQNQPDLLPQVLQQRENVLVTWDAPADEKLRSTVLGCLKEAET